NIGTKRNPDLCGRGSESGRGPARFIGNRNPPVECVKLKISMAKISEVLGGAAAIAKGMGITFSEMLNPTITEDYPDAPAKFQERYRGVHELQRDENGLEKCVACFLCAAACPAQCIYIEAAENTAELRISGGERYAKVYNI